MRSLVLALAALLAGAGTAHAALKPGAAAPTFTAASYEAGKAGRFDLAAALKQGPVVLYFFPAAFTSGCDMQAHDFSEAIKQFRAAGAQVVGITAGHTDRLAEFSTQKCAGAFPVLADPGAVVAGRYDAILKTKPEWSERTSFVIGRDGKIAFTYTDPNPHPHIGKTLAAVRGLKK